MQPPGRQVRQPLAWQQHLASALVPLEKAPSTSSCVCPRGHTQTCPCIIYTLTTHIHTPLCECPHYTYAHRHAHTTCAHIHNTCLYTDSLTIYRHVCAHTSLACIQTHPYHTCIHMCIHPHHTGVSHCMYTDTSSLHRHMFTPILHTCTHVPTHTCTYGPCHSWGIRNILPQLHQCPSWPKHLLGAGTKPRPRSGHVPTPQTPEACPHLPCPSSVTPASCRGHTCSSSSDHEPWLAL